MKGGKIWIAGALLACGVMAGCESGSPRRLGEYRANQAEANNMRLLGFHDLQNRSAYAPELHAQGSRHIAYIGHHGGQSPSESAERPSKEQNGTSDRRRDGSRGARASSRTSPGDAVWANRAARRWCDVCNGSELPKADRGKVYMLRSYGNSGHEIWDVTQPEKPAQRRRRRAEA